MSFLCHRLYASFYFTTFSPLTQNRWAQFSSEASKHANLNTEMWNYAIKQPSHCSQCLQSSLSMWVGLTASITILRPSSIYDYIKIWEYKAFETFWSLSVGLMWIRSPLNIRVSYHDATKWFQSGFNVYWCPNDPINNQRRKILHCAADSVHSYSKTAGFMNFVNIPGEMKHGQRQNPQKLERLISFWTLRLWCVWGLFTLHHHPYTPMSNSSACRSVSMHSDRCHSSEAGVLDSHCSPLGGPECGFDMSRCVMWAHPCLSRRRSCRKVFM